MFNYGTLQSMVESLIAHTSKVLDFERGMEKLLGPDSTVMSTWMSDAPYEMLKTLKKILQLMRHHLYNYQQCKSQQHCKIAEINCQKAME